MNVFVPQDLKKAVAAICPDITQRLAGAVPTPSESQLWWELSACVLSSQVPYALAVSAADAIDRENLLTDPADADGLAVRLEDVLREPLAVEGGWRAYRFPKARSSQLATTHLAVRRHAGTLSSLINKFEDAAGVRDWLVAHAPGLGPKQASMFLRNAGLSYDLAILDRHVLDYMSELRLCSGTRGFVSGLSQYRRHEAILRGHAVQFACPVGMLDWAIWIVMRVARRRPELATA